MIEEELVKWLEEWIIKYRDSSGDCESSSLRLCWRLQPHTSFDKTTVVAQNYIHTFVLYNSTYWIDVWSNCFFDIDFTKITWFAGYLQRARYERFWSEDINKDPKKFKFITVREYL